MGYDDEHRWSKDHQWVPFDEHGNLITYDGYYYTKPSKWELNTVFEDTLLYTACARGRSACTFTFTRQSTGGTVEFMLGYFEQVIPHMVNGSVTAKFTFIKRGANFGCQLVE